MALGKHGRSNAKRSGFNGSSVDEIEEGLRFVHCTGAMGKKRIVVSNCIATPPERNHRAIERSSSDSDDYSFLEALPLDILVRVLSAADHDDLKRLILVSKSIKDAALIAKQSHFAYSTPRAKRTLSRDFELESPEAPNAPIQNRRHASRINRKNLSDITVALKFGSPEDKLRSNCVID